MPCPKEAIDAVVDNVRDVSMRTRWFACAAAWALAPVQAMRRHMATSAARADKDGLIERLLQNLREVTGFLQHDELSEDGTLAWRAAGGVLRTSTPPTLNPLNH